MGKTTKVLGKIKLPPPLKLYIQLVGNIKQLLPLNLKFLWEKTTKVLGNIKIPTPLNFTFNWEDQQRY